MKNSIGGAIVWTVISLTSAAPADPDLAELVRKWDLTGKWATDCAPEAASNGAVAYEFGPDGQTVIDNGQSVTALRIATINSHGDLVLHTAQGGGEPGKVLMLRRSEDTLRPVINNNDRHDYAVRNGKFVASVKETAPLRRCEN